MRRRRLYHASIRSPSAFDCSGKLVSGNHSGGSAASVAPIRFDSVSCANEDRRLRSLHKAK